MKVEIISSYDLQEVQNKINHFIEGRSIVSIIVTTSTLHDFYQNRAPEVCNQWIQYTAVVIVKQ